METNIVIHDGERAIFFGDEEPDTDPTVLDFPGARTEHGPLMMSSIEVDHKFGVWHDFHQSEVIHATDEPRSVSLQWCVTSEVLDELVGLTDGDYGTSAMPIATMVEQGSDKVGDILRALADSPADHVTDELHSSHEPLAEDPRG